MTIDEIKQLIDLFKESGLGEMELERADSRLHLKRSAGGGEVVPSSAPAPPSSAAPPPPAAPPAPPLPAPAEDANQVLVKSPIVGTFYESPSPEAGPFVKVGDRVAKGQVLCIIESMKLMNEIEAEVAGTIVSKLVENGKPVEYGQPLFAVRPS